MIISKSNAKPPQFGFWYLGNGWYLSKDPIGDIIAWLENILWNLLKINREPREYLATGFTKSETVKYRLGKIFFPDHVGGHLSRKWDNFYRVKLRIPYKI